MISLCRNTGATEEHNGIFVWPGQRVSVKCKERYRVTERGWHGHVFGTFSQQEWCRYLWFSQNKNVFEALFHLCTHSSQARTSSAEASSKSKHFFLFIPVISVNPFWVTLLVNDALLIFFFPLCYCANLPFVVCHVASWRLFPAIASIYDSTILFACP